MIQDNMIFFSQDEIQDDTFFIQFFTEDENSGLSCGTMEMVFIKHTCVSGPDFSPGIVQTCDGDLVKSKKCDNL